MASNEHLKLQNVMNQIRYIEDHRDDINDPDKFDQQVEKLQRLNQLLIDEFVKGIAEKFTEKTVKKHQRNLQFFLNEYLAYHLETVFGDEIIDLEYPMNKGFSFNEMKETKTALKKFFTFLHTQQLIDDYDFGDAMEAWSEELTSKGEQSYSQNWQDDEPDFDLSNLDFSDLDFDQQEVIFDEDTDELLFKYFKAFGNLYGVISCDQAYRIICLQNPQLTLGVEDFIDFIGMIGDANPEDVGIDFTHGEGLITYPGLPDQDEVMEQLMKQQFGKPFRVPSKKNLLKYADDDYLETGIATTALTNFYRRQLGIPQGQVKEIILETASIFQTLLDAKPANAIGMVNEYLNQQGYIPADQSELEKFIQVLINFYNNCPQWSNRGWAPGQMSNHPSVQALLTGQKSLPQELEKFIKNALIDPLDVLTWVNVSDDFSKAAIAKITEQVIQLDIPTLDEEEY